MIKICSPQLGVSPTSSLGGEVYDYQTLKGFSKSKFKTLVYLPKGRDHDRSLKNVEVEFAPFKHIAPPFIYSVLMLPYLFRTYKREKFDVLRIHSARFLGVGAYIFHKFYPNVPILTSAVTVDSPRIYYPIEKWIYQNSAAIIVQSQYMKNLLIKKYKIKDSKKISVTFGGQIDGNKKWKDKPESADYITDKEKVILFMGVLIKRKNPQFVLKVFSKVINSYKNCKLVFIGSGPEKNILTKTVKSTNLENKVIFIDQAYGEEKNYWFSRMDLFLFPSLDEGFGLVVTEAMSFGKVVITSNKAAFPEIIDTSKDGFTLALNVNKWVEIIVRLLNNQTALKRVGGKAQKKVETEFNWQRTYQLNAQVIKKII